MLEFAAFLRDEKEQGLAVCTTNSRMAVTELTRDQRAPALEALLMELASLSTPS
jgi:hypothetical protein